MVNAMLTQVNLLARRLQREKSYEVLEIAERALEHERRQAGFRGGALGHAPGARRAC